MDLLTYRDFTAHLTERLAADPRVLGLVLLGSTAEGGRPPDAYSDHDFFVVVHPGAQDAFREHLAWLPPRGEITLHFRETAHGVKVLYADGHLLEFAVFDLGELDLARVNDYRVVLDRADVAARLARVRGETERWSRESYTDDRWLFGQLLTNLLVGVGRAHRGEVLSGHTFVKVHAVDRFVRLVARHVAPVDLAAFDTIDPTRRFERVWPAHGQALAALLLLEPVAAARALLTLATATLGGVPGWPTAAAATVRRLVG